MYIHTYKFKKDRLPKRNNLVDLFTVLRKDVKLHQIYVGIRLLLSFLNIPPYLLDNRFRQIFIELCLEYSVYSIYHFTHEKDVILSFLCTKNEP